MLCITPLVTFGFDEGKRMQVRSIHPGADPDDVIARTGFPLRADTPWPITEAPTATELHTLRTVVDQTGELRPQH